MDDASCRALAVGTSTA